jgi:hypothetical protein
LIGSKALPDSSLRLQLPIIDTRIMPAESQREPTKAGAVIYLASNRPLHLPDLYAEFHENWPSQSLEKTGREPHRAFLRAGRTDFSLEFHHSSVPQAITEPVANSTLHWPTAPTVIGRHVAHLKLLGSPMSQGILTLTCDLTRAIASLLAVTDSLAVCWLNGPALNQSKTFISTAREMFATGLYPLPLWAAVRWDEKSHTLATHGMGQFGAPEIILREQPDAAPLMVDFLFQTALSLLISRHPVREGEILDGPHGRIKVSPGRIDGKGTRVLVLEPAS